MRMSDSVAWELLQLPRSGEKHSAETQVAVVADGHLALGAALAGKCPRPQRATVPPVAIPLRESTSGGGAQDL